MDCLTCLNLSGEHRISPGPCIYQGKYWTVDHAYPTTHLGSLVRYRPQFLEALLATKDAWIIERFIKQAPITFLRHMRNAMDGKYIAYVAR